MTDSVWIRRHGWWLPPAPFREDHGWHLWPAGQTPSRSPIRLLAPGFEYYVCDGGRSGERRVRFLTEIDAVSQTFAVTSLDEGFRRLEDFFGGQGRTMSWSAWYEDSYATEKFRTPRVFSLLAWTFSVRRSLSVPLPRAQRFAPSGWLHVPRTEVLPA
ncbi:hypothetical protein FHR81_000418 [Actinoalloteichus hoggarensis]|uniref:Uncharacterized protein n=1 Tax=Actinoalloteichus hoggarensis TaxID=1470176 RepID=A0A221W296_9PSEU|nr:hypothetical protein [Actinoalloteichus hoggarensis]ASO19902.1 hypothetical protein AHOG_11295 [Actinoalloteichus hoggarensis]MBB5919389.1 hypothetical protein [Actinoalloteichus hoggarensis]